jgi:hypothetical protein
MPGAKSPQPEAPAPPVKVETTAAALQLLQPKAQRVSSPAAIHEPAVPPEAPQEPARQLVSNLSISSAPTASERTDPSAQTAVGIIDALPAVPPPSSASANAVLRDADVGMQSLHVPPASDDETHSDASDGSDSQEELEQEPQQLSARPVPARSVGAFIIKCFIFTCFSHMRIYTESSEDSESEDEITKASKQ